jgi:hypothetical protein
VRLPLIVAAVVVAAVAGCSAVPAATTGRPTSAPSESGSGLVPPLGVPVRDGDLEFAVLGVDRAQQVGDVDKPGMSVNARGVFVVTTLSLRNTGGAPITFIDRYQTLLDDRGRRFETSNAADIYGNRDVPSTRINPGDGLVVRIAFDVPVDTVPARLLLRESESSAGVTALL